MPAANPPPSQPRATYRLQLSPDFGFREAAAIVPYLADLGVSHLYLSPCLEARPGSTHGYDVVDFGRVSEALGGEPALRALADAARAHGLGVLLDIVPNHMARGARENRWWWDVLRRGRSSRFAHFFDVDWAQVEAAGGLVLPVLGDRYETLLAQGQIRLERDPGEEDGAVVRYADRVFPLAPGSLIADGDDAAPAAIGEDPSRLHALLERQVYRLAFWRDAEREIAFRRFFDIDDLVALRMEEPACFAATHALPLRWLDEGVVTGLRVDHVDGLRDPEAYLRELRGPRDDAWIVVEKILAADERLPEAWPVDGTTGYDFLARLGGLFVDPAGETPLTDLYADFTGEPVDFHSLLVEKKRLVLEALLESDVRRLVRLLARVCEEQARDHPEDQLAAALREVAARLPVYRSYVRTEDTKLRPEDERRVSQAVEAARDARADLPDALFELLRDALLLRIDGQAASELALRFQQLSAPAMAKGAEDTAFYCYHRFAMLNEVGGEPDRFGETPAAFHRACDEAARAWPRGLLATSTHDTKRSEDVRARLALLSEIPVAWADAVRRWSAHNERHRQGGLPDRNAEYLLYQTLVGAWPLDAERAAAYMEKATRESKLHTSWRRPDPDYDAALQTFVADVLADAAFRDDLAAFVAPLVAPGRVNALAQTLAKLTAPGVPDLYQGGELWHLALVDPDNRRPVDFERRRRLLEETRRMPLDAVRERADEGLPKLWLIARALALRARRPAAFAPGADYTPLAASGERTAHVMAFARAGAVVSVFPRLVLGLDGDWRDTRLALPAGRWRDALTDAARDGGDVEVGTLLARFPVALLFREDAS